MAVAAAAAPDIHDATLWKTGEAWEYAVRWGVVTAGHARIQLVGDETMGGRPVYHVTMALGTTGVTQSVHAYAEHTDTWIDRRSLLPLRYKKETREGRYARDEEVSIDPIRRRLNRTDRRLDKGTVERVHLALPAGPTVDILGYLFYVRTLALDVGKEYPLTLASGGRLWPVIVTVKDRLQVSTDGGWFDCFYLVPRLSGNAGDTKLRDLEVWLTADARRIPVRLRMEVNVGHITADLISATRSSSR